MASILFLFQIAHFEENETFIFPNLSPIGISQTIIKLIPIFAALESNRLAILHKGELFTIFLVTFWVPF
jgi:hypothetical protein